MLFQAIRQAEQAALAVDTRKLVSREVFVELIERVLPVVSGNLELLLDGEDPVSETVRRVLALAGGVLKTRFNGGNFPVLVEGLLRLILRGELNLDEATALERSAVAILNHAYCSQHSVPDPMKPSTPRLCRSATFLELLAVLLSSANSRRYPLTPASTPHLMASTKG